MSKVDYIVSAGGGVYLPAIIIIHSTNVEVVIMMRNCGLERNREG